MISGKHGSCPDCGHLFLADERDEQRRGLKQVECELVEIARQQQRGYKPCWARHVWAARQRST